MAIFAAVINLYAILKPILFVAKRAFFRNILVLGKENIPHGKPIIIASNHPSSFMDPIFVGLTLGPQIHFLARGDVFKGPVARWALGSMNIIPIYRKEDSEDNHTKNEITYNRCAELLAKNKYIVIYPEGYCVQEKKLRPLKKGTTRLAFHAVEKNNWNIDLHILPVGVNYSNPNKFQSDLVIHYGKPIRIKDYKNAYQEDKNKINYDLTRDLEERMKKLLVIIDNRDLEPFAEQIEILYGSELAYRYSFSLTDKKAIYQMRRAIGRSLNKANASASIEMADLFADTKLYFKELEKLNLRDFLIADGPQKKEIFADAVLSFLIGLFLWPGFWFNYYAFHYPHRLAKKTTRAIEFYPSVLIGSGAIIFTFYFFLSSLIISAFLPSIWLFPLVFAFLVLWAFLTIPFYRFIQKLKGKFRFNKLLKRNPKLIENLHLQRVSLISRLEDFFDTWGFEYPNL